MRHQTWGASLVLGPGARNRGAHADLIPDTLPGVGFVSVDGITEPVRVRFAHVTDDHITTATTPAGMPSSDGDPVRLQLVSGPGTAA